MTKREQSQIKTVLGRLQTLFADPNHWIQHAYVRRKGEVLCYCLLGAIRSNTVPGQLRSMVEKRLIQVISHRFRDRTISTHNTIVNFNDNPRTTYKNVMSVIRQALNFRTEGGV